jgi:hypothetical protein
VTVKIGLGKGLEESFNHEWSLYEKASRTVSGSRDALNQLSHSPGLFLVFRHVRFLSLLSALIRFGIDFLSQFGEPLIRFLFFVERFAQ